MLVLAFRAIEFSCYHVLLSLVDRVSRLPRDGVMPEAMRLYRENIALKAQLDALGRCLAIHETKHGRKRAPLGTRAAQVFAYLLTRADDTFQQYFLSASLQTIKRWATRFHVIPRARACGRPPTDARVVELVVTLKRENGGWGQRRIQEELRRMGIRVSQPTIQKILREHGFSPFTGRPRTFERATSAARDALWALDFFAFRTAKGVWLQALLVIDIYTRELLELRVHDGWDVDSRWTMRTFNAVLARSNRRPLAVIHDHGTHFGGQFTRQLGVLDVDQELSPRGLPCVNGYAEAAIGSLRRELLRHIRVADAAELQFFLDEFRRYANGDRAHQGIGGRTPYEFEKGTPETEVLDFAELPTRRLARREYAKGLLHAYDLAANDVAGSDAAA